jgi:hypothetical protein
MTSGSDTHITVLMTTYQGQRYVGEQIDSVLTQSRLPDLVIVADDASTDGTLDIVRAADRTSAVPTRVLTAESNAGLRVNIEAGLLACPPGIIVLADHDDVWQQDKLALVERAFGDPGVVLWFSDAEVIDEGGRNVELRAWDAVRFDAAAQRAVRDGRGLGRLLHGMTVVGATMAFRSDLLAWALPLPAELDHADHLFLHDGWLAVLGSVVGRVHAEQRPLVRYRQHAQQVTAMSLMRGAGPIDPVGPTVDQLRTDQTRVRLVADRVRQVGVPPEGPPGVASDLFRRDRFLTDRLALRDGSRSHPPSAVRGSRGREAACVARHVVAGDYHRYARGLRTAGKDFAQAVSGHRRG